MYIYIYSVYHVCEQGLYMQPYSSLYLLLSLSLSPPPSQIILSFEYLRWKWWIYCTYTAWSIICTMAISIYIHHVTQLQSIYCKVRWWQPCFAVCARIAFLLIFLFSSFYLFKLCMIFHWDRTYFLGSCTIIIYDSISRKNTALHIQSLKFGFPFSFYFFFFFFFLTGSFLFNVFLLLTHEYGCMNAKFL